MGILKTDKTNYYELDWYVPTEKINKVYLAINGNIQKGTALYISTNVVGYEWTEEENSKIKQISKSEFLAKANADNIVYFIKDSSYNELLNYPKELQRKIDVELYRHDFAPHKRVSIKDKLKVLKEESKTDKQWKNFSRKEIQKNKEAR